MRDLRKYWQEVRELQERLPEFVWLTSLQAPSMVEAEAYRAAQLILAKSHRLASDEEIEALRAGERSARRDAAHEHLRRRGVAIVEVR